MRKAALALATTTIVLLVACGEPRSTDSPEQSLLFLRSRNGVALIEPGASKPTFTGGDSVPTQDWSTIVQTNIAEGETRVSSVDPETGAEHWAQDVPGRLRAKVVSADGRVAALAPAGQPSYLYGRSRTRLTIVRDGATSPQSLTIEGNYEPEAFSTDTQSLFVIRYLPPRAPTKYQVRRLDLNSGNVKGVYTPHEELQEVMGGTARIQEGSPDGKRLYTLYTVGRGQNRYAFIHVLSLDELWAHCIALPPEFAEGSEAATALAVSPNGERLYVVNSASETLAEIDTDGLSVARTADLDLISGTPTNATMDSGSTLFMSNGQSVTAVDTTDLTQKDPWWMEERINGLQESADGTQLYVGFKKEVAILNTGTGETADVIDPPGVGGIAQLGPEAPPLEEAVPKDLECAC